MPVFFTSDQHFGHANVLNYCARPFATIAEHDDTLVARWNARVSDRDVVHVLGDFALCRPDHAAEIARQLRGHKHIVWGNHDKRSRRDKRFLDCFESHHDLVTVKVQDADAPDGVQCVVLCHFAMKVWDKSHHGAWHLYGHSHGSMPDDPYSRSLDVGVDCWDYAPVSYDEVKAKMALKTWRSVDGHIG